MCNHVFDVLTLCLNLKGVGLYYFTFTFDHSKHPYSHIVIIYHVVTQVAVISSFV